MRVRILLFVLLSGLLAAQNLQDFEKKVTEFTLANGMTFLVIERHDAPVVSFHTYANVGAVDDPSGRTGLAHMFEHMAFKGTPTIGSKNWPAEKKALDAIEEVYDRLDAERNKAFRADPKKVAALEAEVKAAIAKADSYVESNEYDRIVESNGGVGMNAGTAEDQTTYFYSFPSNRIELWFLLESERFLHPVFREFYKERDVVREERRMRIESSPQGKLVEALDSTAFAAHPYKNSPAGWASDIESLARDRCRSVLQTLLRAVEPDHRHRRRRESRRGEEARREVFRTDPGPSQPPLVRHRGASAGRREARDGGIAGAAVPDHRLQTAGSILQRQRRAGRAGADSVGRPHRHHLQGNGAR